MSPPPSADPPFGTRSPSGPSFIRQASDRPSLLIFEVNAKITEPDIERMAEDVEAAIDNLGEVDILLVFAAFEGATLGAIFDAEAIKASVRSIAHVRRYGVVGAPMIAKAMINLFDPVSPVDAKTFELNELPEARAWIDRPESSIDH